jgi:catalase
MTPPAKPRRRIRLARDLPESQALLADAGIPLSLPDGQADPGLILADAAQAAAAGADFIAAMGKHRHPMRDSDPPRV